MRVGVLFSGGKDSVRCVEYCLRRRWDVTLLTVRPKSPEAWLWHYPNVRWTLLSAHALGLPLLMVDCRHESRRAEREALEKALRLVELDALALGITRSLSQLRAIKGVADKFKLRLIAPFEGRNHYRLMRMMVRDGYEIRITAVAAEGLGPEWLGRRLTLDALDELRELSERFGFHVGLEGGEAETFVCDGPIFGQRVEFLDVQKVWDSSTSSGYLLIRDARLVPKR